MLPLHNDKGRRGNGGIMNFQLLLFQTEMCQWCEVAKAEYALSYPESLTVPRNGHLVERLCKGCYNDLFDCETV